MNSDPDWSLYRTLLAVIEDGSLSGAARRLGLTQPTVARHVDALEAAAGADLFVRTQRGLTPTDLALSLKPYAEIVSGSANTADFGRVKNRDAEGWGGAGWGKTVFGLARIKPPGCDPWRGSFCPRRRRYRRDAVGDRGARRSAWCRC